VGIGEGVSVEYSKKGFKNSFGI